MARDRVITEYAPHHSCRNSEELGTVRPIDAALFSQSKVSLVNQCRSLESVVGSLTGKITFRQAPQLFVHLGQHLAERLFVSHVIPAFPSWGGRPGNARYI